MRIDAVKIHSWAYQAWRHNIPLLPKMLDAIILLLFNSAIHHTTVIGKGTIASHYGISLVIHKHSRIGKNVELGPHVVLGTRRGSDPGPTIEDDVFLGANCVVLGPITVGQNAVIGAGAVVLADVPPGATVVGSPARIVAIRS